MENIPIENNIFIFLKIFSINKRSFHQKISKNTNTNNFFSKFSICLIHFFKTEDLKKKLNEKVNKFKISFYLKVVEFKISCPTFE